MTLVDSSAWIEFLRSTESPAHRVVREQVKGGELATTGPVQLELLAGVRGATERHFVQRTLAACRFIPVESPDWEQAAALFLTCRRAGVTPRRLFDCLIAAVAIRAGIPVLAQDRDYELIAEHTALELAT